MRFNLQTTIVTCFRYWLVHKYKNIARGTTDPEIDSVTWIKFGNNMAQLGLVQTLGYQVAQLGLVQNLVVRWRHLCNCIGSKVGHQVGLYALPHCLELSVGIELVSSSAKVSSVKSQQVAHSLTHSLTSGPIDRTPLLPGSDKKHVKDRCSTVVWIEWVWWSIEQLHC